MNDYASFEANLLYLFDNADGVDDTVWYDEITTLYERIVDLHAKYMTDEAEYQAWLVEHRVVP